MRYDSWEVYFYGVPCIVGVQAINQRRAIINAKKRAKDAIAAGVFEMPPVGKLILRDIRNISLHRAIRSF